MIRQDQKISVIMGIYNSEDTLKEAIASIVNQTYSNWELIMCDDGSDDHTYTIASELAETDNRIVLIKNEINHGLNYTLNQCLSKASGDYIARMDADDVCVPERFEKQLECFKNHPDMDIVSSAMYYFDENGIWGRNNVTIYPSKEQVVSGNPICHAPVMIKKECLEAVGGYTVNRRTIRVEDVDLWIKLYTKGYRCININEPLYGMRNDKNALNRRKYRYRINSTYVRLKGCKQLNLGIRYYVLSFRPMLYGLIPSTLRNCIKKKKKG